MEISQNRIDRMNTALSKIGEGSSGVSKGAEKTSENAVQDKVTLGNPKLTKEKGRPPAYITPLFLDSSIEESSEDFGRREVSSGKSGKSNDLSPTAPPMKRWTVLFYGAADNDLEEYIVQDVNDIESTVSINDANFVIQLDRGENPSDLSGGWAGCRRFKLEHDVNPYDIDSPVLDDLGQVNMSDPKVLQDFIEWGVTKYPAKHYILIIADHGAGWEGAIQDQSHKGWMKLPQINEALMNAQESTGVKLDILGFDACLMAQTEVAYELKDAANFMVASEEMEGAKGWPYHTILSKEVLSNLHAALMSKVFLEPEDASKFIVASSAGDPDTTPTMSAIDLGKISEVAASTDRLSEAILKSDTSPRTFKTIIRNTQKFGGFKDHYDFCRRLVESKELTDQNIKDAAKETMDALKKAVIFEQSTDRHPDAHGLSINLPSFNRGIPDRYRDIAFAKDTRWDEALEKMTGPGNDKQKPGSA